MVAFINTTSSYSLSLLVIVYRLYLTQNNTTKYSSLYRVDPYCL